MALRLYHEQDYPTKLNALPFKPKPIDRAYHRASVEELDGLMKKITALGVNAANPPINITYEDEHAAQRWIGEKKKQIKAEILRNINKFLPEDLAMLGIDHQTGSFLIRQSGNLTRIAAQMYATTQLKQKIAEESRIRKERRAIALSEDPFAKANLKQLRYAERPLRNEIYELEQIDEQEFPEVKDYLHPHKLNYRLPASDTMAAIAKLNAIASYPDDVRVPGYIKQYYNQQQAKRALPGDQFKYKYAERKKRTTAALPREIVDLMVKAGVSGHQIHEVREQYAVDKVGALETANQYIAQAQAEKRKQKVTA